MIFFPFCCYCCVLMVSCFHNFGSNAIVLNILRCSVGLFTPCWCAVLNRCARDLCEWISHSTTKQLVCQIISLFNIVMDVEIKQNKTKTKTLNIKSTNSFIFIDSISLLAPKSRYKTTKRKSKPACCQMKIIESTSSQIRCDQLFGNSNSNSNKKNAIYWQFLWLDCFHANRRNPLKCLSMITLVTVNYVLFFNNKHFQFQWFKWILRVNGTQNHFFVIVARMLITFARKTLFMMHHKSLEQ